MKNLLERFELLGFNLIINEELMNAKCLKKNSKSRYGPKAFFWIRFKSMERLAEYCNEWISNKEKIAAGEAERKAKKKELMKNPNHHYKVGNIIYNSWGYEQTNIDFFQVVEAKPKSIKIQRICRQFVENQPAGYSSMSAFVMPAKNEFIGEPILKKIQANVCYNGNHSYYIKAEHGSFCEYGHGEKGVYCSWYA
jgi:hypothetical protein